MKKLKFILPGVASAFAIAVSFASVNLIENPTADYIDDGASCKEIQEVPCSNVGAYMCEAISSEFGGPHQVYDDRSGTQCVSPKLNDEELIYPVD